jgi:hypothetical protein
MQDGFESARIAQESGFPRDLKLQSFRTLFIRVTKN